MTLLPNETKIIQTGVIINIPSGVTAELKHIHNPSNPIQTMPAILQNDKTTEIYVMIHNSSTTEQQIITRNTDLAILQFNTTQQIPTSEEMSHQQVPHITSSKRKVQININTQPVSPSTSTKSSSLLPTFSTGRTFYNSKTYV